MQKTIICCDSCGADITSNQKNYHIDFATSRFADAAGDTDYNSVRVDLCESCSKKAVSALIKIADAQRSK